MEERNREYLSPGLRIGDLLGEKRLALNLVAGAAGLERQVFLSHLQKPGLILAGHFEHLNPDKIQVLGLSEVSFLASLDEEELKPIVDGLLERKVICFIVTKSLQLPPYFRQGAEERGVPLLVTAERTSSFIKKLTTFLEKRLAPQTTIHGVLMAIQGVGVLILGKSGIGKSECALDLVYKGHRLVADDLIYLQRIGTEIIIGHGPELIRHHMEIRGLGIINIKDLFGVVSVMESARVELVIELVEWSSVADDDRLGLDEQTFSIMEVEIPRVRIPVSPGRNLSVILEVAARNHLLKKGGFHAARAVDAALTEMLRKASSGGGEQGQGPEPE